MNFKEFTRDQRTLRRRLLDVLYRERLSHIGSCLSALDIIDAVYKVKKTDEKFILSNGHAGLALYVVLEKYGYLNIDSLANLHIHPDRDPARHIDLSTGSLGQGLPVALGMALGSKKNIYCLISDGETAEGSIWESLRIGHEQKAYNLKIIVNVNGWAAYMPVDVQQLEKRFIGFGYKVEEVDGHSASSLFESIKADHKYMRIIFAKTNVEQLPFLKGLDAHYYTMNDADHRLAMEVLQ